MPKVTPIFTNFSAGEFSPLLDGRIDFSKYYSGAKVLENFIILPQGGIKRRPGTYYVTEVKDSDRKTRLIPFQFSTEQTYIVEAGDQYFRFYQNHGQILSGGTAYEISTPYLEADLFNLQFAQDADTMWLVHPSYKPRKLTRGALSWDSYTKLMLHCDGTDASTTFTDEIGKTVTANGDAQIDTAQYKFGGASGLFDGNGDYLSTDDHADWYFNGDFTIDFWVRFAAIENAAFWHQYVDASNMLFFGFDTDVLKIFEYISGSYTLRFTVPFSPSINTWYHIALVRSGNNWYVFIDGIAQEKTLLSGSYSVSLTDLAGSAYIGTYSGAATFDMNGWIDEFRVSKGIARWTANFTPPVQAYSADVTTFALNNYAPTADPFGVDGSDDCPSCVAIFEQRIFFADSNNDPQKVWGSVSGDFEDMTTGAGDSAALVYTIGSEQVNAVRWLSSGKVLLMGTLGGLFSLSSGSNLDPVTPSNITVKRETTYGSVGIVPKKIGNYVYFIQRNLKTIRETAYSYDEDEYRALDMTILAPHITNDGIVDMDYQQSPYNLLWCVRDDGEICVLTREINQEVFAWSRQITDGYFESVAVIAGDGGDDEVWFVVKRTIQGATKRYIEYLKGMDFGDEQEDAFFVDSGLSLDSPFIITGITQANPGVVTTSGAHGFSNGNIVIIRGVVGMTEVNQTKFKVANVAGTTFKLTSPEDDSNINTTNYLAYVSGGEVRKCVTSVSGLSHLEGETVDILADGITATPADVSGGAVILTDPEYGGGEIHAGLEFTSKIQTLRIEAGSNQGTAQNKIKRIQKIIVRLYETIGMKAGSVNIQDAIDFGSSEPISLFSGDKEIIYPADYDKDAYIVIYQDEPQPLTILAIITYVNVFDS